MIKYNKIEIIGITGSDGFIGKNLSSSFSSLVVFPEENLFSLEGTREFVKKCDVIFHLAGKNREPSGDIIKNNLRATANLVLSCFLEDRFPKIVFLSSVQVTWLPLSEYAISKKAEEDLIKNLPNWIIYRVPNIYGPGCRPNYNSVVATFCHNIVTKKKIEINDPDSTREFLFVKYLINEITKLDKKNEIIALKGELLSVADIFYFLTRGLGEHAELERTFNWYEETYEEKKNVSYP